MDSHLIEVLDDSPLRQGDLIFRPAKQTEIRPTWGFVLNADCDILQSKSGHHLTYLEIIPATLYLEEIWAPAEIQKLAFRNAKFISDNFLSLIKKSSIECDMSPEILIRWATYSTATTISNAVNKTKRPLDPRIQEMLHILCNTLNKNHSQSNLDKLSVLLGKGKPDSAALRQAIFQSLDGNRGFPDYFFLPDIPQAEGIGHVILLRDVKSVSISSVFLNATDMYISGKHHDFLRIGRLADRIRFSIVQKMTFLFSRIGLPNSFEEQCEAALTLLSEQVTNLDGAAA